MADPPARKVEAAGARSVAAGQIGVAATGDQAHIDARTTNLAAGSIPEPAKVAAPPGTHNLPRRPARVFVGRSTALGQLQGALAEDTRAVVTQAVYGLGGVGKSELALHHANAHRADYSLIWWITAEDRGQIETGLAALAARLCPEVAMAGTTTESAGWAAAWLQAHDRWLLVLDNVNDPADMESLLGQLTGGHILLTTRRDTGWDQIADPIRLDVLNPGAAAELLTTRTGHQDTASQDAAVAIAAELGYLPLALDQAVAYTTQTRTTLAAYLQRLRQHPATIYAAAASGQAQRTVARLWDITIEAIRSRHPPAINLLHILACYAPDSVPRVILGGNNGTGQLPVDEALAVLASYSMITLQPQTVSMHRLVQAVLLTRPPPEEQGSLFGGERPEIMALKWLDTACPADANTNMAAWPLLRELVVHAESLAKVFPPDGQPQQLAWMQHKLSDFLDSQGQYEQALAMETSALAVIEAELGPDHPATATLLDGLAVTYSYMGRDDEALPLKQRAVAIAEAALGPDHPYVSTMLSNLGITYSQLGRDDEALPLKQRALAISEATLGPDHPDTAIRLSSLAVTLSGLGRNDEALPLQQRALAITEATLGPDHPTTAIRLANLAVIYSRLGRRDEALPLQQRALAIIEAALGADHPYTTRFRGAFGW